MCKPNNSDMASLKNIALFTALLLAVTLPAQNVGINYDGSAPTLMLDVKTQTAVDGIKINNMAANGDPIFGYELNNARIITMGVDDSDADKFKIGTTALTTNTRLTLMTNGRLGLNTTTPGNLFHMTRGTTAIGANSMALFDNTDVNGVALSGYNAGVTNAYNAIEGVHWYSGTANTPAGLFGLHIYQSAAVNSPGIGVYAQSNEWQGIGSYGARFNSGGANTGWGGVFVNDLGYTGFFGLFSDASLKQDIQPMSEALAMINQLNPVTFKYKTNQYPNAGLSEDLQYGFIAQEVQQVIPEAVKVKSFPVNGASELTGKSQLNLQLEDRFALDITKMVPILVKAVQEQAEQIEDLQTQIEALQLLLQE